MGHPFCGKLKEPGLGLCYLTQFCGELKEPGLGLCYPTQFCGELKEPGLGLCYPTLNAKCAFRMGHAVSCWVKREKDNCRSFVGRSLRRATSSG